MEDLHVLLLAFGALVVFHRSVTLISAAFAGFRRLDPVQQVEWSGRVVNGVFQVYQTAFNLWVIFFDKIVAQDLVRSYSEAFHLGATIVVAFYLYDSVLLVLLPKCQARGVWLFHHCVCIALLVYNFNYRAGAFPASSFLISSALHTPNEIRWVAYQVAPSNIGLINVMHVTCVLVGLLTHICAPIYMLHRVSAQQAMTIAQLLGSLMRWQCLVGSSTVFFPHCIIVWMQVEKMYFGWNQGGRRNPDLKME